MAIDAGTTGVTAVVVERDGRVVATGHQELARHSPASGWVEHAPEQLWQATLGAVRAVLGRVDRATLEAVGVTGRRGTILLWDRETLGSPRPAIGWQDRRTAQVCDRLRAAGHEDRLAELTGLGLDPSCSGTKLAWIAEHEPHTWALVESGRYAVGTVDSYLVTRMTRGTYHVTDVSNACRTLLLDLGSGDWSDELCSLFGVPRDALPDLVPSWGEVTTTDRRSFLDLSLPIAGLAGDQQAALFGQACFDEGDARCGYAPGAAVLTTVGTTLPRARGGLLPTAGWRSPDGELTYALEGALPGCGMTPEAIASEVRDLLAAIPPPTALRVDGAAAADDLRCQLLADRVGVPVERPTVLETAPLGAAFLAGLGAGVWSSTDQLRHAWRLDRRFEPAGRAD
nr:FGGY family carbohydrate kinase [Nocardioides panaciterrulae]